jgi:hypothetical protein
MKPLSRQLVRRRDRPLTSIGGLLGRSALTMIALFTNLIKKRVESSLTEKAIKGKSKKVSL